MIQREMGLLYLLTLLKTPKFYVCYAARILEINNRVGSLEAGKDGDVALFDGDPFEYTSHVIGVLINGQVVSDIRQ